LLSASRIDETAPGIIIIIIVNCFVGIMPVLNIVFEIEKLIIMIVLPFEDKRL